MKTCPQCQCTFAKPYGKSLINFSFQVYCTPQCRKLHRGRYEPVPVECSICATKVVRVRAMGRLGAPVFTDEKGQRWNGRQCPECKYNKAKKWQVAYKRTCRRCSSPLGMTRFFECTRCVPALPVDTLIYCIEHQ